MRRYKENAPVELEQVICNKCAKKLKIENGILKEGVFSVRAEFGYFSRKDGLVHAFDLCEDCYDEMVAQFVLPVEESENSELMQ